MQDDDTDDAPRNPFPEGPGLDPGDEDFLAGLDAALADLDDDDIPPEGMTDPILMELTITATVLVPVTHIGEEWTIVASGKVDQTGRKLKKRVLVRWAKIKADMARLIPPEGELSELVEAHLAAGAIVREEEDQPTAAPPIPGQGSFDPEDDGVSGG